MSPCSPPVRSRLSASKRKTRSVHANTSGLPLYTSAGLACRQLTFASDPFGKSTVRPLKAEVRTKVRRPAAHVVVSSRTSANSASRRLGGNWRVPLAEVHNPWSAPPGGSATRSGRGSQAVLRCRSSPRPQSHHRLRAPVAGCRIWPDRARCLHPIQVPRPSKSCRP